MVAYALALAEADVVRWILISVCFAIIGTIAALLVHSGRVTVVLPPWSWRLLLLGVASFLGAIMYALFRAIGREEGEPLSFLSGFALLGLVFLLSGLVWVLLDQRALAVPPEHGPNGNGDAREAPDRGTREP